MTNEGGTTGVPLVPSIGRGVFCCYLLFSIHRVREERDANEDKAALPSE